MPIEIDAVYHDGAFHPQQPVPLQEGAHVRVAIQSTSPPVASTSGGDPLAAVLGIADGPTAGDAADRHDDYLYGNP